MELFAIRRRSNWSGPDELQASAARSREVGEQEMPDRVRWIRTYAVAEDDDALGTICIYEAADEAAAREHAERAGMSADEVLPVVDTVIVRPDP